MQAKFYYYLVLEIILIVLLIGIMISLYFLISSVNQKSTKYQLPTDANGNVIPPCNLKDQAFLKSEGQDFAQNFKKCGISSWGNKDSAEACLQSIYTSLNNSCTSCFGEYIVCSKNFCSFKCMFNPHSAECKECSNNHCRENLLACTQLNNQEAPF